jgi:hypothetical protein
MAVHDVDVDPVAAGLVDGAHLLAELGEISGEDGRGNDDVAGHWSDFPCHCREGGNPTPPGFPDNTWRMITGFPLARE